jgi:RhtB (resistance to homoserine/threonine) family protein
MPFLPELLTVLVLQLLAVITPGPDFAIVCRNSLVYSRSAGIYAAIGVMLGNAVHITYSIVGIGFIISKSILLFSCLKLLGAAYLIYIGYKSFKAQPDHAQFRIQATPTIAKLAALRMGFLNNVLNPKATLFCFSLFTQVLNASTPFAVQLFYGLQLLIIVLVWFILVAAVISHPSIRRSFVAITPYVEKVMGALFIALGIKVALSTAKQ